MNNRWLAMCLVAVCPLVFAEQSNNESAAGVAMTPETLDAIISMAGENVTRRPGLWTFNYNDVQLTCLVNSEHDRMRIVAPITLAARITGEQRDRMLAANFHTALDARYSTDEGVVYSAFIHPLSSLSENQVLSAMDQVASLVLTFGTTYSSGTLRFLSPGDGDEGETGEPPGEITT